MVVVVGAQGDKASIAVASDESVDAQRVVRELALLVGGGGGGSSRLALAGGRDVDGVDRVLAAATAL